MTTAKKFTMGICFSLTKFTYPCFSINRLQSCRMKIYWELNNLDFRTNKLQSVFASKVFYLFSVVLNKMI